MGMKRVGRKRSARKKKHGNADNLGYSGVIMGSRPYYACVECTAEIIEDLTTNEPMRAWWCGSCHTYEVEVMMRYE